MGNNRSTVMTNQQSFFGLGNIGQPRFFFLCAIVLGIELGLSLVESVTYSLPPPKKICVF